MKSGAGTACAWDSAAEDESGAACPAPPAEGAGVPCGAFIPMLAIGACIGALLNRGWLALGMDAKYADLMVMICMAAFFTSIVKAPITGIVMVCELTWSFAPLLPVVIGVSVGYFIGDISRTDGIYEKLLELFEKENGIRERAHREVFTVSVQHACIGYFSYCRHHA